MSGDATVEKVTAGHVEVALRAHFDAPKYAVVTGVRDDGGWDASRTCDALVMGTWQSVGRHLHGVEIKVARSDWQREIQDITKAEAFALHCDYWWIAAPPGVVKVEELPATWGLLEVVGKGMKVRRPATRRDNPDPIPRGMLASLCRRVVEQSPAEEVLKAALVKARKEIRAEFASERAARSLDFDTQQAKDALAVLEQFQKETGVYLHSYNLKTEAARFKRFVENERALERSREDLMEAKRRAGEALEIIDKALEKVSP